MPFPFGLRRAWQQKSLSWRQWKTDASGSDHTDKVSMEIHGIALQVIFKSRYHGGGGGGKYLLQKLGLTIY